MKADAQNQLELPAIEKARSSEKVHRSSARELVRRASAAGRPLRPTADTRRRSQLSSEAQPAARRASATGVLVPPPKPARVGSSLSKSAPLVTDAAAASAPVVPPEKPAPLAYGNIAFDLAGGQHDIAALRERRNAAVTKGMVFMHKFFKKNNFAALHEVGDDAPSIFFECWCGPQHLAPRAPPAPCRLCTCRHSRPPAAPPPPPLPPLQVHIGQLGHPNARQGNLRGGGCKGPSALFEDTAPSAHPAPPRARAVRRSLQTRERSTSSLPWPRRPASALLLKGRGVSACCS